MQYGSVTYLADRAGSAGLCMHATGVNLLLPVIALAAASELVSWAGRIDIARQLCCIGKGSCVALGFALGDLCSNESLCCKP